MIDWEKKKEIVEQEEIFWEIACLTDKFYNTTSLLDLLLGKGRDVSGLDDDGSVRESSLSEDLWVSEGEEVDNGGGAGSTLKVLLARLGGDEGPQLPYCQHLSIYS